MPHPSHTAPTRPHRSLWLGVLALALGSSLACDVSQRADAPLFSEPVNDWADALTDAQEAWLNQILREHREATRVQIAVLTVLTTAPETIEDYSMQMAEVWRGGDAGDDQGVLFTLAIDDRRMRLEVGLGLEPVLTDGVSRTILDAIKPDLRDGRAGDGVTKVVASLLSHTGGEALATKTVQTPSGTSSGAEARTPGTVTTVNGATSLAGRYVVAVGLAFLLLWFLVFRTKAGDSPRPHQRYRAHAATGALCYLAVTVLAFAWPIDVMMGAIATHDSLSPGDWTLVSWLVPVVAIMWLFFYRDLVLTRIRFAPRVCGECAEDMTRAEAKKGEERLDTGQRAEVRIKSVEYDLWSCGCDTVRVEDYPGTKPSPACPACSYRTFRLARAHTIRAATYHRSGLRALQHACAHCGHVEARQERIARKQRRVVAGGYSGGSSGGGGGWSGGGGSFGGGGASASW